MANCSANGSRGHHRFTLNVNETGTSTQNNTSIVSFSFVLTPIQTGWDWNIRGISYKIVINGVSYTGTIQSYNGSSTVTLKSGSLTIPHNADGTKSISFSFSVTDSAGKSYTPGNASSSGSLGLSRIPRQANLTSADNFNDEGNPTIKYNNPAGNAISSLSVCISLTGAKDDIKYRDIPKTGNSYTFNLTEKERELLRNSSPNNNKLPVKFYLRTIIGGNTYYSILNRTMTIINGEPTFGGFNLIDTNKKVTDVLKFNSFIQNSSSIQLNILAKDKMNTFKGASPKHYVINFDGKTIIANYSENDMTVDLGKIENSYIDKNNFIEFSVIAYDSRGNSTKISETYYVFPYQKPTINLSGGRINNFEDETLLEITGTTFSLPESEQSDLTQPNLEIDSDSPLVYYKQPIDITMDSDYAEDTNASMCSSSFVFIIPKNSNTCLLVLPDGELTQSQKDKIVKKICQEYETELNIYSDFSIQTLSIASENIEQSKNYDFSDIGLGNIEISVNSYIDIMFFEVSNSFEAITGKYIISPKNVTTHIEVNEIDNIKYRYCLNDVWSEWNEIKDYTINSFIDNCDEFGNFLKNDYINNFVCNNVALSVNKNETFIVQVQVYDQLDYGEQFITIDSGQSIFFISSNKKACYINDKRVLTEDDITIDNHYSTEEKLTGGKWIDGKSIYRKVVGFNTISTIDTGFNSYDTLISANCLVKASNSKDRGWRTIPWLYDIGDKSWEGGFRLGEDGKIYFQVGSSLSDIQRGHIVLEYTKIEN